MRARGHLVWLYERWCVETPIAVPSFLLPAGKWVYKNYLKEYEYESMTDAESFARSMFG